jgi:hypothetical protein
MESRKNKSKKYKINYIFYDKELYEKRNLVEMLFLKIKAYRKIATRYEQKDSFTCWKHRSIGVWVVYLRATNCYRNYLIFLDAFVGILDWMMIEKNLFIKKIQS